MCMFPFYIVEGRSKCKIISSARISNFYPRSLSNFFSIFNSHLSWRIGMLYQFIVHIRYSIFCKIMIFFIIDYLLNIFSFAIITKKKLPLRFLMEKTQCVVRYLFAMWIFWKAGVYFNLVAFISSDCMHDPLCQISRLHLSVFEGTQSIITYWQVFCRMQLNSNSMCCLKFRIKIDFLFSMLFYIQKYAA